MIFFVNETRIWRTNLKPGTNVSILSQFTGTCGLLLSCPSVARKRSCYETYPQVSILYLASS